MNAKDIQAELTRLEKENLRLKLEREILKKAAAGVASRIATSFLSDQEQWRIVDR